ncbi:MAG: hypothetical protein ABIP17_09285 [Ilumatobacteraceae bacterium]
MFTEWLIYGALMAVLFLVLFRDRGLSGIVAGLLLSLPLFLLFGFVMAKFGYQRKSLKELRAQPRQTRPKSKSTSTSTGDADDAPRARPAPTSRTGGGTSRRPSGSGSKRKR